MDNENKVSVLVFLFDAKEEDTKLAGAALSATGFTGKIFDLRSRRPTTESNRRSLRERPALGIARDGLRQNHR